MAFSPLTIELDWPVKDLWPNGGFGNRFAYARAFKQAKHDAFWAAKIVKPLDWTAPKGEIPLRITAYPKTANAVDKTNLIFGMKAHFDGIADALGVNDRDFCNPPVAWGEPIKGGKVIVTIGGEA